MRGSGTRWVGSGVGVGASLLLHALLIAPFILGASPQRSRIPNKQGAGAAAIVSAQEPVMTLIYLNQTNPNERQYDLNTIASRGFASNDALLQIASPDPTPALETLSVDIRIDDSAAPTEAVGDQANHALLFGRYGFGPALQSARLYSIVACKSLKTDAATRKRRRCRSVTVTIGGTCHSSRRFRGHRLCPRHRIPAPLRTL
jgi:hypothetical protein